MLRPEYFAGDTSRFHVGQKGKAKSILARADVFKKRLYEAKRRSVDAEDMDVGADQEELDARSLVHPDLFPEFAIDYEHYTLET